MSISWWPAGIVGWCWSIDTAAFAFDFAAIFALLPDTSTTGILYHWAFRIRAVPRARAPLKNMVKYSKLGGVQKYSVMVCDKAMKRQDSGKIGIQRPIGMKHDLSSDINSSLLPAAKYEDSR